MIKEDYLKELNGRLSELAEKYGVPIGELRIDHGYCAECEVEFPYEMASEYWDQISLLTDEFEKFVGIHDVYDPCRDDGLRKGQGRKLEITVKRGRWYLGPIDKAIEDEEDRMDSDPEYRAKKLEEQRAEMRKHWRENLIPIPPPPKDATDEAYLTLDYKYYDQIKSGEKTTEFRGYSPFWVKRLLSHPIKTVRFQRGYGGPGHPPPEQMVFKVKDIVLYEIETKKECPPDNPCEGILPTHIAIDLGERIEDPTTQTAGKVDAKAVYDKRVWGIVRGPGDEMMKAKFQGEEVNVLVLNKVLLYAVEQGMFTALPTELKDVPERGEVYLFCDPFVDRDRLRDEYRDLKTFAKENGIKVPTLSKIPNCDGSVNGKADYHIFQEDGEMWIEFENVQPLDRIYEIVGGEFTEYHGPLQRE